MKLGAIQKNLSRTANRTRSPRLEAFGFWKNVGEGSRQIRFVTSGQGLALQVLPWRIPEIRIYMNPMENEPWNL